MIDFPPMYTLQVAEETRERQMLIWKQIIIRYCDINKVKIVDISSPASVISSCPIFENKKIQRKASKELVDAIINDLINDGNAEYEDSKTKKRIMILTKTLIQWAAIIYDFAKENALIGSVYTVYEIHSGDLSRGSPLSGMDPSVCYKSLLVLQKQGKAEVYGSSSGEGESASYDETGIKFL